jgi:hypothetical protein
VPSESVLKRIETITITSIAIKHAIINCEALILFNALLIVSLIVYNPPYN